MFTYLRRYRGRARAIVIEKNIPEVYHDMVVVSEDFGYVLGGLSDVRVW